MFLCLQCMAGHTNKAGKKERERHCNYNVIVVIDVFVVIDICQCV